MTEALTARTRSRRLLLGWSAASLPVAPLLFVGIGLGPHGVALLTENALAAVDPAIPVALAALGVFVGLGVGERRPQMRPLSIAGVAHALLTAGVVALGLSALTLPDLQSAFAPWLFPVVCGVCAASSLTLPGRPLTQPRRYTDALIEAEVAVTIVIGAVVLSVLGRDTLAGVGVLFIQALGVATVLALAGWLLVLRTTTITERRVFAMATLLLVGGAADFLAFSPLLTGLAAGLLWERLGGPPRDALQSEILYLQHPFVVLVLLAAGARTELSSLTMGLAAAYVTVRVIARFVGGRLIQRAAPANAADLHLQLVAPGIFGVAFGLNVGRVVGLDLAGVSTALSVVVLGTLLSDLTARLVSSRGAAA